MNSSIFPAIILIAFPILWCFMSLLLSIAGGWLPLTKQYSAMNSSPNTPWKKWRSMNVSRIAIFPVNYSRIVRMAFDDDAVYLSTFVLFRIGHAALKLPYDEMEFKVKKHFFTEVLTVKMHRQQRVKLVLFGRDKDSLLEKLQLYT